MLNALARWLVTFTALSLLLTWCFLNRAPVAFDLSPLHDPVMIPLFATILGSAVLGFVWGAVMTWLASQPARTEARRCAREVRELSRRLHQADLAPTSADSLAHEFVPEKTRWRLWR